MKLTVLATAWLMATLVPVLAQPNIIVLWADDLPHNIRDLNMRRVVGEIPNGREYVNAFTCHSVCAPARACLLTGQTTDQHGVDDAGKTVSGRFNLLPEQLQEAGYRTGIFGKDPQGIEQRVNRIGFDEFAVIDREESGGDFYFDPTFDSKNGMVAKTGYTETLIGEECINFIETAPQPFFVWCAGVTPHAPNIPKPEHVGKCNNLPFPFVNSPAFNEANLADKPSWFDPAAMSQAKQASVIEKWRTTCETMIEADKWWRRVILKAGPNTVVMVSSDHGIESGHHRLNSKNVAYEESIRVPLIVWGGNFNPGTDDRLVSVTDVTATIFALAGATPGRPMDPTARDLRGTPRTSVTGTARWGENEVAPGPSGLTRWVVEDGWRYFSHEPDGGEEMYDMVNDPEQVNNLATQPPQSPRQKRYRRMLN